jgi:hypothetical protein
LYALLRVSRSGIGYLPPLRFLHDRLRRFSRISSDGRVQRSRYSALL